MIDSSNSLEILVPNLPESVEDATVAVWHKKEGDKIQQDEILLEIETDKIMLEIPASQNGTLEMILEKEGSIVRAGQILARLKLNKNIVAMKESKLNPLISNKDYNNQNIALNFNYTSSDQKCAQIKQENNSTTFLLKNLSPSIKKLITEYNLNIKEIKGTGIKGRITRQDIETYIKTKLAQSNNITDPDANININIQDNNISDVSGNRKDTRISMNRLRKKIAERLLYVTNSTAMLTTFNEVNMQSIISLRNKYNKLFIERHGTKLGFMSFFIKSVLEGLRRFPEINACIDGDDIVYHTYFDISIAVSTERGLVTPVLRNVNKLSISNIEKQIKFLSEKSRKGKLTLEELTGGNFTITNGGIFGSLMSTPIINPPQSAILGMHTITERPMAINGQVIILPMMYLALSYDHRLIDGKDSVSFLKTIKELIEDPTRLLLDI
ncbi:dihydrolipoyllysine-residue succinyltransferase component of 2-oxoglutarate dehydrogenase complex [Candidatus Blochmanniella vafra str. BVAF]|uniref:Dihydrolipoyllysine-residue succinyltransferase component of 2-oxoglutarate dehydrogenase complex n=1 Tax=Blochmanniella vafra (strain BVAF) TaxID=859654 RepID=E8Q6Y1_BLOVB|nr:2-oxoglutarate dehydrogenase complex dihydrolipoyllysine-residue succinyltransferase [Candidatus Blochmannia vafer]ADV33728.1 dihydrolipoyllysine-residue succinyltransferase component of 2-oxoglutarate dehydrogenase complex [Candidatus Blochmannia vafer str. BVAF]